MKKNVELSSVELQRILLACCNITVSMRAISSQWNALSRSQWNAFLSGTRSNSTEILAFPQRSISRSICVPVTRSLLGYFCPVLQVYFVCTPNDWNAVKYNLTRLTTKSSCTFGQQYLYIFFSSSFVSNTVSDNVHYSLTFKNCANARCVLQAVLTVSMAFAKLFTYPLYASRTIDLLNCREQEQSVPQLKKISSLNSPYCFAADFL